VAKIYVSSTYTDLVEYRQAAVQHLTKLRAHQVTAMENYVASDDRPVDQCLSDVRACDVYIGIFAWRYGYVPPPAHNPNQLSITELEYREAKTQGKACLIFLLDEDAPWKRSLMDSVTGENGSGARVAALRKELGTEHTRSVFDSPDKLVLQLSAALQNLEAKAPRTANTTARPSEIRELKNSLLFVHDPVDAALANAYARTLQPWLERPIFLSERILHAVNEAGFDRLESDATRCMAGLVLVTPTSLSQLQSSGDALKLVFGQLRARLGAVSVAAAGVAGSALPPSFGFAAQCFEVAATAPAPGPLPGSLLALRSWLEQVMAPWGSRVVGLPLSLLCMTKEESDELVAAPDMIGKRLSGEAQERFREISDELSARGVDWQKRYQPTRSGWQPFGSGEPSIGAIVETMADAINARQPLKLRQRRIKLQWYPFEAIKEHDAKKDTRLGNVYRNVARTGCIFVVDEMSLFHPDLNLAFQNSPFSNNEQVSLVTLSPFDPTPRKIDELLEKEPRRKLAGALDRFATYYDPQCELAVADARRLRRWLHYSLPETVSSLREPPPDQSAMDAFFAQELGSGRRQSTSEYPWAGGGGA